MRDLSGTAMALAAEVSGPEAVKSMGWAIRVLLDVLDGHRRS
jgi:hypothetical protein